MDEIKIVSAAGYEQNIVDAPASVYVITKEELGKKSFNDLTEILKNVPGVYVTGGSAYKDISIRGMGSEYTLYLIDGKPMNGNEAYNLNSNQVGIAANSLPPVSMIERIEVIKGPMSSLYGSEALGGIINIITKKVPNEWSGNIKTEYTKNSKRCYSRQLSKQHKYCRSYHKRFIIFANIRLCFESRRTALSGRFDSSWRIQLRLKSHGAGA